MSADWIAPEDIETSADVLRKLEEVEQKLAQREKLTNHKAASIRQQLITLIKCQVIKEDELVAEWLDLYTTHTYWYERESQPKNVSVSIYDGGDNQLQVWGTSFTIPGALKRKDGKVDEADRIKLQKMIQRAIASLDLSHLIKER